MHGNLEKVFVTRQINKEQTESFKKMQDTDIIVYINSFTRSGSTLLGMLLNSQQDLIYLGEVRNFHEALEDNRECYCGARLRKCSFWSPLIEKLDKNKSQLYTKTKNSAAHKFVKYLTLLNFPISILRMIGRLSAGIKKEIQVVDNILKIYNAASDITSKSIICDSSHRNTQVKLLWLMHRKNLKIIHLVRDGRGVSNSVMKRTNCSMKEAANSWKRNNIFSLLTHVGISKESILRVKYENICLHPFDEVEKICKFIGIPFSEKSLQLLFENSMDHHNIGGSSTIRRNKLSRLELDEKWRKDLDEGQKKEFEKIAGKLNRKYGYN